MTVALLILSGCITTQTKNPDGSVTITVQPDQSQIEFWTNLYQDYKAQKAEAEEQNRQQEAELWERKLEMVSSILERLKAQ